MTETENKRPTIIAVGGSKGGIGKSVFSANLGIHLSKEHKTVIIDLDLGGANMHFYLGHNKVLKKNINDFLVTEPQT
jgi:flagellar biosynthesis protein FlhG